MPEKKENALTAQFLSNYGPKIRSAEEYDPADDTCDQRSPVNDPEALYNSFIVPAEIMDELEDESLDDFEGDVYEYEDRSDLGVDIALAAELDLKKSMKNIKSVKQKASAADEEDAVSKSEQSAAE